MMAASAALSIAQAGVGFMAANQQATEQNAYYDANRKAAVAAADDRYASINNQVLQEREAASQKLFQDRIASLKAQSTAKVASGEAGVTGLSVNALLGDFETQFARQEEAIQTNFGIKKAHAEDEANATYHQTVGRINSVRMAGSPGILPFAIQGAAGALKAYTPQRSGAQYAIE